MNTICVPLYASRGLYLTSLLYAAYWINAAVSSEYNMRLRPDELRELAAELHEVLMRRSAAGRIDPPVRPEDMPDDGREPVFLFLHAFPEQS